MDTQISYPDSDDSDDDESDIDRVLDGLYVGGMRGAMDENGLRQRGITHVLNMATYRYHRAPSSFTAIPGLWLVRPSLHGNRPPKADLYFLLAPPWKNSGYPEAYKPESFKYLIIGANDVPDYDISQHFPETNDFIHEARQQGAVYVHCYAGMSRAPSAVIAYLMSKQGLKLQDAASTVKAARRQAQPNSGFWRQLEEYQSSVLSSLTR